MKDRTASAHTARTLAQLVHFTEMAARLVAHGDEQVDYEILWNALANRLPAEAQRIRAILAGIDPSGDP